MPDSVNEKNTSTHIGRIQLTAQLMWLRAYEMCLNYLTVVAAMKHLQFFYFGAVEA